MKLKHSLVLTASILFMGPVSSSESDSVSVRRHRISKGNTADSVFAVLKDSDMLGQNIESDSQHPGSLRVAKRYRVDGTTFMLVFTRERDPGPYVVSGIDILKGVNRSDGANSGSTRMARSSTTIHRSKSKSTTGAAATESSSSPTDETQALPMTIVHGGSVDIIPSCKPEYPKASRRNEETGRVTLSFMVSPQGQVLSSHVARSTGFRDLDRAASDALSKCTFHAAMVDEKAVTTRVDVQYSFDSND